MADRRAPNRKGKETDEFFHIRAKGHFLKVPVGQDLDDRVFVRAIGKKKKTPSRRDLRKQSRIQKKAKRATFFSKKRGQVSEVPSIPAKQNTNDTAASSKVSDSKGGSGGKNKRKRQNRTKETSESQENYKLKLLEDNKNEDKEIRRLEKLLRLDKKKKLSSQFSSEGLDYLLEVCDFQMISRDSESEEEPNTKLCKMPSDNKAEKPGMNEESCSENENSDDDCNNTEDDKLGNDDNTADNVSDYEFEDNDVDRNNKTSYSDDHEADVVDMDDDYDDGGESDNDDNENNNSTNKHMQVKNQNSNLQKYVAPQLRKQELSEVQREHLNKIRRQVKGLLNRVCEGNMSVISSEIENLFIHNSRNDMNKILTDLILDSCVSISLMPDKLLMEHVMLLTILTIHIGIEVGAFFVEKLAELFDALHDCEKDSFGQGKQCANVVALFGHLYNFKIIHCGLIYDIIRRLVDAFTEQDIELLLLLLKSTGAEIRRDDPASLKDIILQIQAKAASAPNLTSNSRIRFMLEIVSNLRNNNLRKIPGYDPSRIEHLRKFLRSLLRQSSQATKVQLQVSLEVLLTPETKGRWWITGSSLKRGGSEIEMTSSAAMENTKLLELARKQRMNTDVRKNIFLVIMTSEDFVDAFEKLMKLNLKDVQSREIIHVLVDCCLQEKTYNPFYAYLGQKFCEYSRSYQVTLQYSFWDKFKVINDLTPHSVDNLSRLMAHLISTRALSLSILKVVNFVELDKPSVRLFTKLFHHILLSNSEEITRNVFERISAVQDLASLRQCLRIFIKHFVGKAEISKTYKGIDLKGRLKLVDDILGASDAIKL
ncbi:nucleolar MIF4G domain-containing protein 1-like [Montipora capricornis]|uniref:nucleolar MIF4G domain-containing protein 1-like n=1 Tax=Montipora capricornis TaxID=246305 RepID=UPI0035F2157F